MVGSLFYNLCVALVLAMTLTGAEFFKFTQQPLQQMIVKRGEEFSLSWKYEFSAGESMSRQELIFINKTMGNGLEIIIADGYPLKAKPGFLRLKNNGSNASITISNTEYQDTGIYYLKVSRNPLAYNVSHKTELTVEGKPELFSDMNKKYYSMHENTAWVLKIVMRGVPKPVLVSHWNDKAPIEEPPTLKKDTFFLRYSKVNFSSLSRDRCNRSFIIYAKNKLGISEKKMFQMNVLFKPEKVKNVAAHYTNDRAGVEVTWDKQESGLCDIGYRVDFLNSTKTIVSTKTGNNIVSASSTNSRSNNIEEVKIQVITSEGKAFTSHNVTSSPKIGVTIPDKGNSEMLWIIVGSTGGGFILASVIIISIIICNYKKSRADYA